MSTVRKPRTSYTIEEDTAALRAITALDSGIFSAGSAAVKVQHWVEIAERLTAQGVEVAGDALRRHVTDLVKKHKKQGPDPPGGRMRWGMPWPKSDEEVERDKLLEEYISRVEEAKKAAPVVRRPATKAVPPAQPAQVVPPAPAPLRTVPSSAQASNIQRMAKTTTPPPNGTVYPNTTHTLGATIKKVTAKRKEPEPVVVDDDDDDDLIAQWLPSLPSTKLVVSNEAEKLDIKRRRLEMDERMQNRMLDIQAEQIKLQREQLRLQAEAMRSMAESTQAIARALHALQNRGV